MVARGDSSAITQRRGLLQQAYPLGLALVLLVTAMVRCQHFPLVFLCSGEGCFATSTHSGFFSVHHAIFDVLVWAVVCVADEDCDDLDFAQDFGH